MPRNEESAFFSDLALGSYETTFDRVVKTSLRHEGGYVNNPRDPGGETKFGISKRSFPNLDIQNLTQEDAKDIYRKYYWEKPGISSIADERVSGKIFDLGINVGPGRAIGFLQRALNRLGHPVDVDNLLGPRTLKAANQYPDPAVLLDAVRLEAEQFYKGLNRPEFLRGWLNRLKKD